MKRVALAVTAVLATCALAISVTRPKVPAPTGAAAPGPVIARTAPTPRAPRISRREVMTQRDRISNAERRRLARTRLLQTTLVTAASAHGVSILTGQARTSDNEPQQMTVTPDGDLTVREIAAAISRICAALKDPCLARDYRFFIQTPTGQAPLPAQLLHARTKDPR